MSEAQLSSSHRSRSARYRHADEGTLIAWAKAGDETAFAMLAEAARRRLVAVCHRSCRDPGDAADACQDALLAAWQNLASFRGDSGFTTWLCAIGRNACRAIERKRRPTPMQVDPGATTPRDAAATIDLRDAIDRALAALDPSMREVVVLREYGGLSYDEIALTLGVELNTVRTRRLAELLLEEAP